MPNITKIYLNKSVQGKGSDTNFMQCYLLAWHIYPYIYIQSVNSCYAYFYNHSHIFLCFIYSFIQQYSCNIYFALDSVTVVLSSIRKSNSLDKMGFIQYNGHVLLRKYSRKAAHMHCINTTFLWLSVEGFSCHSRLYHIRFQWPQKWGLEKKSHQIRRSSYFI